MWNFLEYLGPVTLLVGHGIAFEAQFLQLYQVLLNMVNATALSDPVTSQVQVHQLRLRLQIVDIPYEVVVQIKLFQLSVFLKSFNLLYFIEGEYECRQVY